MNHQQTKLKKKYMNKCQVDNYLDLQMHGSKTFTLDRHVSWNSFLIMHKTESMFYCCFFSIKPMAHTVKLLVFFIITNSSSNLPK